MKKEYILPQAVTLELSHQESLLNGSGKPTVNKDDIFVNGKDVLTRKQSPWSSQLWGDSSSEE